MDPLTASIALSITQLCIAGIMAGIYFAAPVERCTQLWALSGVLMGIGLIVVLLNAGRPVGLLLALGNVGLYAGCVLVWMGLRSFFGHPPTRWGYGLIGLFAALFLLLVMTDAGFTARACLSSASLVLIFSLCLHALLARGGRRGYAHGMAISGLLLMIAMHLLRIIYSLHDPAAFRPATISHFGAVVLYLVPLAGTLLFFSALLLLYFERIKRDLTMSLHAKQQALETQLRFVDMFSHEYRTPLAVIRTNLDILHSKDQASDGRLAGNLAKMRRALLRLVEIAESVLVAERSDDGNVVLQPEPIVGPELLRTVLDEAAIFWGDRAPQFRLEHADAVVFNGDRRLLKTALLNLVDNAIKYGPERCIVSAGLVVGGQGLTFTIRDNGPGIPANELRLVFDKYFRGRRSSFIHGSGMGLYLVRRIAHQHAGEVSLDNQPHGGLAASITLPLRAGES